jgi:hypothetical protein
MNNISLYTLILLHWSQLQLIWTINITTLKVIFKLYDDLLGPTFICQTCSGRTEVLEVERLSYLVLMIQN